MAVAGPGQLNLDETPNWGSRSVDCFEKIEQIGEGTYGYVWCVGLSSCGLAPSVLRFLIVDAGR